MPTARCERRCCRSTVPRGGCRPGCRRRGRPFGRGREAPVVVRQVDLLEEAVGDAGEPEFLGQALGAEHPLRAPPGLGRVGGADAELAKGAPDRVVLPCRRPRAWLPRSERAEQPALHLAKRKSTWRLPRRRRRPTRWWRRPGSLPTGAHSWHEPRGIMPGSARRGPRAGRSAEPSCSCARRHGGRPAFRAGRCGSTPEPAPPRPRRDPARRRSPSAS